MHIVVEMYKIATKQHLLPNSPRSHGIHGSIGSAGVGVDAGHLRFVGSKVVVDRLDGNSLGCGAARS